jgi:hypothetical protein
LAASGYSESLFFNQRFSRPEVFGFDFCRIFDSLFAASTMGIVRVLPLSL